MRYEKNNLVAALIAMSFLAQLIYADPVSGAVITKLDLNIAVVVVACMGATDFFQTPYCQEHIL